MSEEWKDCLLGDVITLQRGFDLPERDRQPGDVPIVSSSGITGYHTIAKVQSPGVVTGRYGTLGEVFYVKRSFWPLNTTLYVRDFKGNNPLFVSYFLRTLNLAHQNAAGAVPGLNRNALHLLPVRRPSLSIQRTIASILSAYDDLIENNARRIAILEEMAQMLYEEWFVKFRFPGHEQVKMVESTLGMIPDDWEVKTLGDITLNFDAKRKPLSSLERNKMKGEYPYYGAAKIFDYVDAYIFDGKYLLVAEDGSVITNDKKPVLQIAEGKFWANNHTHIIQGRLPISTDFLYLSLANFNISGYITGAAQPKITQANLNRISIVVPTTQLLNRFDDFVEIIFKFIKKLQLQNANLRRTSDLLLPKLISGEIDVSSWSEGNAQEIAQELAASAVGTTNGYEPRTEIRRVAEAGPIEPIEKDALEWHSLWEG